MVKYMVRLHTEARESVLAFVHTGWAAAAKRLQARMLLKADVGAGARHKNAHSLGLSSPSSGRA
jgi:hypothetical protein